MHYAVSYKHTNTNIIFTVRQIRCLSCSVLFGITSILFDNTAEIKGYFLVLAVSSSFEVIDPLNVASEVLSTVHDDCYELKD